MSHDIMHRGGIRDHHRQSHRFLYSDMTDEYDGLLDETLKYFRVSKATPRWVRSTAIAEKGPITSGVEETTANICSGLLFMHLCISTCHGDEMTVTNTKPTAILSYPPPSQLVLFLQSC